jgi:hypothetical protein
MVTTSSQIDVGVDRRSVYRYLGYGSESEPPPMISSLIDEYMENAHDLIEPSYSYVIRDVLLFQDSRVLIEGPVVFQSEIVARLLGQCRSVAVLVATIGSGIEDMAYDLSRGGLVLQASVLDAIGSATVENVADFVQRAIAERVSADGYVTSRRFSPGYCDWDIGQQLMVFRAVDRDSTEVELTDDCLMVPRKSLSGIVGIGRSEAEVRDYDPCKTCDKQDCVGRR